MWIREGSRIKSRRLIKKLIYILGPWKGDELHLYEDYIRRFMQSGHPGSYIPKLAKTIQSLASSLPDDDQIVDEIELSKHSDEEQEVLLDLTQRIYNFVGVQFYASGLPRWGQCVGDPLWHTKAPD